MEAAAGGGTAAFHGLVTRHEGRVLRYLERLVGPAEAPDLCQETFLSLWKMRGTYRGQGRLTVLLFRIARSKAMSHLRWRKVRHLFAARSEQEVSEVDVHSQALRHLMNKEQQAALFKGMMSLPVDMREVVTLRFGEELDYATISAITGTPEGTLRSRAHRGLAMLNQRLTRNEHGHAASH